MGWARYLFSFRGRLNRRPYWLAIPVGLLFVVVGVAIVIPYLVIEHPDASDPNRPLSPLGVATIVAIGLLVLSLLIFNFAIIVKRLHDRNKSAWWIVPFFLLPSLMQMVADPRLQPIMSLSLGLRAGLILLASVLSLWAFVELGLVRGTIGENRYGSDPLLR